MNPREAKVKKNVFESRKHSRRATNCATETLAKILLGVKVIIIKVNKIVEISPYFNCMV